MRLRSAAVRCVLFSALLVLQGVAASPTLNYQGRITAGGTSFTGQGYCKFQLVNGQDVVVWANNGSQGEGAPSTAVGIEVNNGLFNVELGDAAAGMSAISPLAFHERDLWLRTWFSTNSTDFEQLVPDVPIRAPDLAHFDTGNLLVVDDDGNADFDNIQAAIDALSSGDPYSEGILIMPGWYEVFEPLRFPTNRTVMLRGAGAHEWNVWIGHNGDAAIELATGANVFMENLTLSGQPAVRNTGGSGWVGFRASRCQINRTPGAGQYPVLDFAAEDADIRIDRCDIGNGEEGEAVALSGGARLTASACSIGARTSSAVSMGVNSWCDMRDCELSLWSDEGRVPTLSLKQGGSGNFTDCNMGGAGVSLLAEDGGGGYFSGCEFTGSIVFTNGHLNARFVDCRMNRTLGLYSADGWLMASECRMDGVRIVGGAPHVRMHDCYMHPGSNTTFYVEDAIGLINLANCELHASDGSGLEVVASAGLPEDAWVGLSVIGCQVGGGAILRNDAANPARRIGTSVDFGNSEVGGDQDGILCDGPGCGVSLDGSQVWGNQCGIRFDASNCWVSLDSSEARGSQDGIRFEGGGGYAELDNSEVNGYGGCGILAASGTDVHVAAGSDVWGGGEDGIHCAGSGCEVSINRSYVYGYQDGVECDNTGCEVNLSSSDVGGYGGCGILAAGGAEVNIIAGSDVWGNGGPALLVSGPGEVFIRDSGLWAEGPGDWAGAFLDLPSDGTWAMINNSHIGGEGPGIECRGGTVLVNQSQLLSGANTMALLWGGDSVFRFNQCSFSSLGETWGAGGTNAAVTLCGNSGDTPTPTLFGCSLEPASQASYAIALQGGATTGSVIMANCCLTAEIDPRIDKVAPKSQDAFGNIVMPRKP